MKVEQLRTLVSIAEQGSLSAAARAKRISQPAVTKQVQRMEAETGLTKLLLLPSKRLMALHLNLALPCFPDLLFCKEAIWLGSSSIIA